MSVHLSAWMVPRVTRGQVPCQMMEALVSLVHQEPCWVCSQDALMVEANERKEECYHQIT